MTTMGIMKRVVSMAVIFSFSIVGLGQILPSANATDDNLDPSSLAKYVYPIKGSKIIFEKDIDASIESGFPPPPTIVYSWPQFHYDNYKSGLQNIGNLALYWDYKYTTSSSAIRSSIVISPVYYYYFYGAENGCFYKYQGSLSTCYPSGWKARSTPAIDDSDSYVFFAWENPTTLNTCFERHKVSDLSYSWGVCHPNGLIRGPITFTNNVVYYIVDYPSSSQSIVFAWINSVPNMASKWTRTVTSTSGNPLYASPIVTGITSNDIVLFGAKNGYVYCLKGNDGSILTSYNTGSSIYVSSSFDITNKFLFVINSAGKLYKFSVSYGSGSCSLSVVSGWPITFVSGAIYSAPAISPSYSNGYRLAFSYCTGGTGYLKIINVPSKIVQFSKNWGGECPSGQLFMSSPAVSRVSVFFVEKFGSSNYGDVGQYTLDGTLQYSGQSTYKLGPSTDSSPALYHDSSDKIWAFVGSDDGTIHAYQET